MDDLILEFFYRGTREGSDKLTAWAVFHEDEFFGRDYNVPVPGVIEFKGNGAFLNLNGKIITLEELASIAKDGGAQSQQEWKKKICQAASRKIPFSESIERLAKHHAGGDKDYMSLNMRKKEFGEISLGESSVGPYQYAVKRTIQHDFFGAVISNAKWSTITVVAGATGAGTAGQLGGAVQLADQARGIVGELLGLSVDSPQYQNLPSLSDSDWRSEVRELLKKQGYYDVKEQGDRGFTFKIKVMSDWGC